MEIFSFGNSVPEKSFKVLNERVVRGSSGVMLLIGFIAFINGFILKNYIVLPYISGILLFSFLISVFVNPKFSPTVFIAWLFVRKQSPIQIGAIQKRFAWSLGSALSSVIFVLSIFLLKDESLFDPVCMLCIVCLVLLFLETAFGICVGCKLYFLSIKIALLKAPKEKPNCMGDSCEV